MHDDPYRQQESSRPLSENEAFALLDQYRELTQRAATVQEQWHVHTAAVIARDKAPSADEAMAILKESRNINEQQATLRAIWSGHVEALFGNQGVTTTDWARDPAIASYYQTPPPRQNTNRQSSRRAREKKAWELLRQKLTTHVSRSDMMKEQNQANSQIAADAAPSAQLAPQEQLMDWGDPPANSEQIAAAERTRFEQAKRDAMADPEKARQTKAGQFAIAQARKENYLTSVASADVQPAAEAATENTIEMVQVRDIGDERVALEDRMLAEIRENTVMAMNAPAGYVSSHEATNMVQDDLQVLEGIHDKEMRARALQLMNESCFAQEAYAAKFIDMASSEVQAEMAAAVKARDAELAASEAMDQSLKEGTPTDVEADKEPGQAPAPVTPPPGIDADALARVKAARDKDRQEVARLMGMNTIEHAEAQVVTPPAPVDLSKPAAAPAALPSAKQAAAPDPSLTIVPPEVESAFLKVQNKFYHPKNQKRVAFEDHGKKLHTALSEAPIVLAMVQIAEARGWKEIKVSGTPEFRKEAWRAAALRGISVQGYKPTELDLADLERRMPKKAATNEIAATPQVRQTGTYISAEDAALLAAAKAAWGATPPLPAAPVPPAAQRAPSTPQPAAKAPAKAAAAGDVLVKHGPARYEHNKDNPMSYYVVLANDQGKERTVWGVKLGEAIQKAGVKPGDRISLIKNGESQVEVDANVTDQRGVVVAKERIGATRNEWQVKAHAYATEPAEQVAQAHPDLAGALALPVAIGLQAQADGYAPAQRAYIESRVRQITARAIESGNAPGLQRRETVEFQQQPQQEMAQ